MSWTSSAQAAVTESLTSITPSILAKVASVEGVLEAGAYQLHDGIGVFRWVDTIPIHVDSIPDNQRTMGMVLVNDGGFVLATSESDELLALPVGAVWKLNSHVPHQGIKTEEHARPQFVGILWDYEVGHEPAVDWFVSEALMELERWASEADKAAA